MNIPSALRRGAAAMAVVPFGVALGVDQAAAATGTATREQSFTFTSQQTGARITCVIEHSVSAQVNAEDRLLIFGSTEVIDGPAVCDDSLATILMHLDDGSGDDLSQYAYGTGGYVAFSNHFPSSWTFTDSGHSVYFDACSCYAPDVGLQPK
jgi:hypothetical protein